MHICMSVPVHKPAGLHVHEPWAAAYHLRVGIKEGPLPLWRLCLLQLLPQSRYRS